MDKLQRTLGIAALVLTFGIAGSTGISLIQSIFKPDPNYGPVVQSYVRGTVIKEKEIVPQLLESSGTVFSPGKKLKVINSPYVIQVKTEDELYTTREGGLYTISVKESYKKPLEALALAIEEGSRIKVKEEYWDSHFGENKVGYLFSDEIIVCGKK